MLRGFLVSLCPSTANPSDTNKCNKQDLKSFIDCQRTHSHLDWQDRNTCYSSVCLGKTNSNGKHRLQRTCLDTGRGIRIKLFLSDTFYIFNSLYLSQSCQKFTQTTSNWFSKTSTKNISMPNPISAVSLEFLFCIPRCKPVNWNYFHYLRIRPLPVTPQNLNEYIKCFYKLSIMILYSFSILLGIFCLK